MAGLGSLRRAPLARMLLRVPAPWRAFASAPRGVTAVLVAICLVVLCAFLALALNVGHLYSIRGELQNAADSGALAGAQDLNGTLAPLQSAIDNAERYAERHSTDTQQGVEVTPNAGDVEIGFWERGARTFTAYPMDSISLDLASCVTLPCINAVRVRTYRDEAHSGTVPIAMGPLIGSTSSSPRTEAVAVTGGPCGMKCIGLPIVLPDCGVNPMLGPPCVGGEYNVLFKNDMTDTGAWADLGSGANTVKCLLNQSLVSPNSSQCAADTNCKVDTQLAVAGDVGVINGQINSACQLITQLYAQHPEYKYVVPVVHASCPEKWVQSFAIAKFATVQISWAPPDCSAGNKFFTVRILCDQVTNQGESGGCAAAGTFVRPGLVR